jgi:hypothetical protein
MVINHKFSKIKNSHFEFKIYSKLNEPNVPKIACLWPNNYIKYRFMLLIPLVLVSTYFLFFIIPDRD